MSVSWGPWRALGATIGAFLLAGAVASLLGLPMWASSVILGASFLGVSWALAGNWRELGFSRPRPGWFPATALAIVAFWVFSALYSLLGTPESNQPGLLAELGPWPLQVFLIVLLAPVAEEVLFRGVLFAGFLQRMPLAAAAALSALIFALPHLPSGAALLPLVGVLGFMLALLYWRTNSIWPPIFLHSLNNALALAALS